MKEFNTIALSRILEKKVVCLQWIFSLPAPQFNTTPALNACSSPALADATTSVPPSLPARLTSAERVKVGQLPIIIGVLTRGEHPWQSLRASDAHPGRGRGGVLAH